MVEVFGKMAAGIFVIILAIYLVSLTIIFAIVLATLVSGLLSVYMVKTGTKGLVIEKHPGVAMLYSMGWAAVFTGGCVVGSFALLGLLEEWYGPTYGAELLRYVGGRDALKTIDAWQLFVLLFNGWLFSSACLFFAKTTLTIYLANRTAQALNTQNHSAWLAVVPPVTAIIIWFGFDHWDTITRVLSGETGITEVFEKFFETALLPLKLAILALERPHSAVEWAENYLRDSNGSMFKIAELDPSVFCIIAVAGGLDAITGQSQ